MGFLFKYKSVALFEDIQMNEIDIKESPTKALKEFYNEADRLYEDVNEIFFLKYFLPF